MDLRGGKNGMFVCSERFNNCALMTVGKPSIMQELIECVMNA
jgi:hypothetical protein